MFERCGDWGAFSDLFNSLLIEGHAGNDELISSSETRKSFGSCTKFFIVEVLS